MGFKWSPIYRCIDPGKFFWNPDCIFSVKIYHKWFLRQLHCFGPVFLLGPSTVSPLHSNLQVVNIQRSPSVFHQCQAWVKLQLALHLLLLMILQLYHLPPLLPPPVSNSSCAFTQCQPLYADCSDVLLSFSRHCTVRLKMFYFLSLFFVYYFCDRYYKPIILQYYIANCVSWVPRLTWLNLQVGLTNTLSEWNMFVCRELTVFQSLLANLLLLLNRFSHVWLCATPETAAHQAPRSLGFSRQEHWSGLPFPCPMHESEKWKWSRSVMSYS